MMSRFLDTFSPAKSLNRATDAFGRSLALTMVLSFAVSFAFLWWRRPAADASLPPAPADAAPERIAAPAATTAPVSQPLATPAAAAPMARLTSPAPPPVVEDDTPQSNPDDPPLPLIFSVARRSAVIRDESTDYQAVRRQVNEFVILNSSNKPLAITAIESDPRTLTSSQIQFLLAPGMQKHVGPEEGLAMQSGDQIILRSPKFSELAHSVP